MSTCDRHAAGLVELYFYGELDAREEAGFTEHVTRCLECRRALEDLQTIRAALAARPDVAAPAGGDWAPFMARLGEAVRREHPSAAASERAAPTRAASAFRRKLTFHRAHTSYAGYLAMAALLALVTLSVVLAWQTRDRRADFRGGGEAASGVVPAAGSTAESGEATQADAADPAFAALSEQHFERSKLVVFGLVAKDPSDVERADWEYERSLAGTLLNDTRLYRQAAEQRGLASLARVMEDLELVLLQASMSDKPDARSLEQLQRLIRKRDLVTKIGVVTTTAGI